MSDVPIERDESGRFVKADIDVRPPDLEQEYHPMAVALFGWTRITRLPLILILLTLVFLLALVSLSTGTQHVNSGLTGVTGFYALAGGISALSILIVSVVIRALFGRSPDYYGEADTQPDDVEERL
ncbi:MAG: hypothetical protein AAGG45_01085 [Pseudomonadota bacterium]